MKKYYLGYFFSSPVKNILFFTACLVLVATALMLTQCTSKEKKSSLRQRISIDDNWKFFKYDSASQADNLIYDVRPGLKDNQDDRPADAMPTEAAKVESTQGVLKPWIMPTGNEFLRYPSKPYVRPEGDPGSDFAFVQSNFNDGSWEDVNLPHDWAIKGPFMKGKDAEVGGSMGRLPSPGVSWYRKKIDIPSTYANLITSTYLDGAFIPMVMNTDRDASASA